MVSGVVCIIIGKPGGVLGVGADFSNGGAAGFSPAENQERRAKNAAKMDFVRRQCSELIAKGMDAYDCDRLVDRLRDRGLVSVEIETVGSDEPEIEGA